MWILLIGNMIILIGRMYLCIEYKVYGFIIKYNNYSLFIGYLLVIYCIFS